MAIDRPRPWPPCRLVVEDRPGQGEELLQHRCRKLSHCCVAHAKRITAPFASSDFENHVDVDLALVGELYRVPQGQDCRRPRRSQLEGMFGSTGNSTPFSCALMALLAIKAHEKGVELVVLVEPDVPSNLRG